MFGACMRVTHVVDKSNISFSQNMKGVESWTWSSLSRDCTIRVQQQLWSNCFSDHHEIRVNSRKTQLLNVKRLSSISNVQSALQFAW